MSASHGRRRRPTDPLPEAVSNHPFWTLFEALPIGAVLFDPADDAFLAFNDSACRQLGYTRERFAGLRIGDIDAIRSGAEIVSARRTLVPGVPQSFRTRQRAADGSVRDVQVLVQYVELDGRKLGYAVWQDVTEHERALTALRAREQQLARVQRIGRVGGFEIDPRHGFGNRRSPECLKLPGPGAGDVPEPHEDRGRRLHPEDRERADRFFRETVAGPGRDYAAEYRIVTPDGETRWISAMAEIERDADGRPLRMIGAHIDVTAQKEAEIALADHAERLREADRRKDEFLAMLGHELRNPMAAMRSVSELLGRLPASLPDEVRRAHDVIDRQLDHLTVLVDDLLDVARIHTGRIVLERRLVEIGGIVRTALEQSAGLIERRRHRCEVTLPDRPVHVEGDPARLIQVVTNLLNNAAKFTEPGGRIGVTAAVDGGTVEIVVEDNGVGIAPELLPHVFDLFVQSQRPIDRAGGGLGVGLTLAQEIVHQHGGTISAHSDESGSRFRVSLPCVRGSVAAQAAPAATVNRPAHLHRVLVIDDNLDAAETLAMLLEIDGHEVRKLHDGSQVIDEVRRFAPRVVLLDLGLPGRDGFDIARELRACSDLRQPVLIAITGYGQESDRRRSRESGFDHHFVKPIRYEALSELIGGIEPFPSGEATAPAP